MPEYRSPAEERAQALQESRVQAVLDQAVTDGASMFAAMELGEPQDVVELWVNRLWDGVRDGLRDDRPVDPNLPNLKPGGDRLAAILLLLADRMHEQKDRTLAAVREAGDA